MELARGGSSTNKANLKMCVKIMFLPRFKSVNFKVDPPPIYCFDYEGSPLNYIYILFGQIGVNRISLPFPLHNFQKCDCLCMLANTFGIGLLLLMTYL